jgi:hypothetical protein
MPSLWIFRYVWFQFSGENWPLVGCQSVQSRRYFSPRCLSVVSDTPHVIVETVVEATYSTTLRQIWEIVHLRLQEAFRVWLMNDIHSRNSHGQIYRSCTVRARTVRWECDCNSFARIVYWSQMWGYSTMNCCGLCLNYLMKNICGVFGKCF